MSLPITLLYGGALCIWFLVLTIRVIQGRQGAGGVSLGDGGNPTLQRRIRGHGNFVEYVPLVLIMLGMLEASGASAVLLHAIGAALLIGRILHGYAFAFTEQFVMGRMLGIVLTLVSLLVAGGAALVYGLQAL